MKKLYLYPLIFFLTFSNSFAETKKESNIIKTNEELIAKYVLTNMQQDYTTCYVFYKIGTQSVINSNENSDLVEGIEASANTSLKLAFETGELANMTIEEMKDQVNLEIKKQLVIIKNDDSNYSILLSKYAQLCKNIIQNKKKRIAYWEKEAESKFK
jgi:hypothetical protein